MLENLIKEEISLIFLRKLQDPSFGFLVTNVRLVGFKIAKVYISVLKKKKRICFRKKSNTGFIRAELASRIRIKFVPDLKSFIDDSLIMLKDQGLLKKFIKMITNETTDFIHPDFQTGEIILADNLLNGVLSK
jgi:ribosome-binding factor A